MDEKTFSRLVVEHQDMLFRVAYTLLRHREDCRDALQEALLKAWKSIHTLRNPQAFRGWIIRIVVNCATDMLRKRKVQTVPLEEDTASTEMPVEDVGLQEALRQLDAGLRLPIILHYLEGFSIREIAQGMRLPQGTVKNRLHRGRRQLAAAMNEEKEEDDAWYSTVIDC